MVHGYMLLLSGTILVGGVQCDHISRLIIVIFLDTFVGIRGGYQGSPMVGDGWHWSHTGGLDF